MQERLSALADRTEALRVENDELMGRVHKNEMQLSRAEDELSQLSSRIWEEYELTYALAEEFRTPDFKPGESEKRVAAIRCAHQADGFGKRGGGGRVPPDHGALRADERTAR